VNNEHAVVASLTTLLAIGCLLFGFGTGYRLARNDALDHVSTGQIVCEAPDKCAYGGTVYVKTTDGWEEGVQP
jgi:hypothetical protein